DPAQAPHRRDPPALVGPQGRHVLRWPAARASLFRGVVEAGDSRVWAAPGGETGTDRLGPAQVPVRSERGGREAKARMRPVLSEERVALSRSGDRLSHAPPRRAGERLEVAHVRGANGSRDPSGPSGALRAAAHAPPPS